MLWIVGVGPGDPELITLKAVRTLRAADEIALADSGAESAVEKIAGRYWPGKPVLRLRMPMNAQSDGWCEAHEAAARLLLARLNAGVRVAYPVLGDPSLYATSAYLLPLIAPHHPCEVIPGVPAMCAAAAMTGAALAVGRQKLTVLPGLKRDEPLPEGNVVILKAGKCIASIRKKAGSRSAYFVENAGMADGRAAPLDEASGPCSYFTTVILSGGH